MVIVLLPYIMLALIVIDICVGSASISLKTILELLIGKSGDTTSAYILTQVRIPRVITAVLVGSGLSLAGLLLQTLFHNPMAGPYVLGISSGAGLGVGIYTMAAAGLFAVQPFLNATGQVVAAMVGAGAVFLLVLAFSWRLSDTVSLLIIGIMLGALASSIVGILQFFAPAEMVHRFVIWSLGSLGSTTWLHLSIIIPVFLLTVIGSIIMVKPLDAFLVGENHARIIGVNIGAVRLLLIIVSSIMVGTITAFTGPIGFIGMTVPHMVRLLTRKVTFRFLLPGVIFMGPIILLVCDMISQLPGTAKTLPINGVTALFGAPIVIALILKARKIKGGF